MSWLKKFFSKNKCDCGMKYYCKKCNSRHWRDNFRNWTSGDANINELIRELQLNANNPREILEWIEYSNLKEIEYLAEGGFGSVYKAIWKDGQITRNEYGYWNIKKSQWIRDGETLVTVKKFRNGMSVSSDLLNEVNQNWCDNKYKFHHYSNLIMI